MKKLILLSSALLGVVFLAGCGTQPTTPAGTVQQKEQPVATQQPAAVDETADWASYTNKELGFTISYPNTYHIYLDYNLINYDENKYERGNPNGVKIQIQRNGGGNLGYDLSTADGIKKLADKLNADRVKNDPLENASSTPIISFPLGVFQFKNKVLSGPGGGFSVYRAITNSGTHIALVWDEQNDQETVNKILSTFKQTPAVQSTADWKTYKNDKYEFEFQYPDDIKLEQPVNDVVVLKIGQNGGYLQIQNFVNQSSQPVSNYRPNGALPTKTVIIGGKTAQEYYTSSPQGEAVMVNLPYTDLVINFSDKGYIEIQYFASDSDKIIINQILSTLKFTK